MLKNLPVPTTLNVNHHYRLLDRAIFPMVPYTIHVVVALDAIRRLQYRPNDHQVVAVRLLSKSLQFMEFTHVYRMQFSSHKLNCDVSALDQNNVTAI